MTPLTKEVTAALARDDPTPKPCGAEPGEHVPPPAPPVAFPIPLVVRAGRVLGAAAAAAHQAVLRMLESAMEVIWDLLIFLALVAVGLVVLNLLAHRR
jgi:hypothetical protein